MPKRPSSDGSQRPRLIESWDARRTAISEVCSQPAWRWGEGLYGPKRGTARFGGWKGFVNFVAISSERRFLRNRIKPHHQNVGPEILNETSRGITAFVYVRRCTNHNHNLSTVAINRAVIVLPELGQAADAHADWKAADR